MLLGHSRSISDGFLSHLPTSGVGFPSCPSLFLPIWVTSPGIGIPSCVLRLVVVPESQQKIRQTAPTFPLLYKWWKIRSLLSSRQDKLHPGCLFCSGRQDSRWGKQRGKGWPGCHLHLAMWAWENHLIWSGNFFPLLQNKDFTRCPVCLISL